MSDESQLQVRPSHGVSSLSLSKAGSRLVTRGLKDSASLAVPERAYTDDEVRQLAEDDDAGAQFTLGVMYYEGERIPQDYAEAARWFRKASEQRHLNAQVCLGRLYERGEGVPQDCTEAIRWYREAAENGSPVGQFEFGYSHYAGEGVPKDDAEAARWFRRAAELDNQAGQCWLGLMYRSGTGVPKDLAEAFKWLARGAAAPGEYQALSADTRDSVGTELYAENAPKNLAEEDPEDIVSTKLTEMLRPSGS